MNVWLVLAAIVAAAALFVVLPVGAAAFTRFRARWRLPCPADGAEAQIRLDPLAAARGEMLGRPDLSVLRCSSWPERAHCAQDCLRQPAARWRRPRAGERPPRGPGHPDHETILVPLDGSPGSESVLAAAADVARARGARLRLLRVAPPAPAVSVDGRTVSYADQETARIENEARGYLRRLAARLGGVGVDRAVRFGDPAAEIVRDADESHADLVAMATRRGGRLRAAFRRSVTRRVEREADVPVLLVPYGQAPAGDAGGRAP